MGTTAEEYRNLSIEREKLAQCNPEEYPTYEESPCFENRLTVLILLFAVES